MIELGVAKSPDVDGGWAWVVLVAATSAFTISTGDRCIIKKFKTAFVIFFVDEMKSARPRNSDRINGNIVFQLCSIRSVYITLS